MRTWISAMVVIASIIFPITAAAQTPLTLSKVDVEIMPEFDKPEVLVIYHLFLSDSVELPADLTVKIPTSAGDPYNVAVRETDGQLYNIAWQRTIIGDWASIQFTTTANEVQVEYYDPGLQKNDAHRDYTYTWEGGYAVDSLSVQIQQPVNAQNMQITPSLGTGIVGDGDLVYYQALIGAVPADNTFSISVSYDKPDDTLTIESLKVESSSPVTTNTTGRMNINEYLPYILALIGVLLIGGGIWYFVQSGKDENPSQERRRHARPSSAVETTPDGEASDVIYCQQCGKKSSARDNFCRACGARLRKEE